MDLYWSDNSFETLGFIPSFLDANDPRGAAAQINDAYVSGWSPMKGFELGLNPVSLKYPGDPRMYAVSHTTLRQERLYLFPSAWLLILQPDNSFEVSRID